MYNMYDTYHTFNTIIKFISRYNYKEFANIISYILQRVNNNYENLIILPYTFYIYNNIFLCEFIKLYFTVYLLNIF